jgi:AraC-like DNA-binding protein/quercetin dioxygenase-like cupin family protein
MTTHRLPLATPVGQTDAFVPHAERPVRVRARDLPADAHLAPHRHDWGQLAYCDSGVLQVSLRAPADLTCIVPPSRAVWVPPGALHLVKVLEAARLRTLYVCASAVPADWTDARVIPVSPLLRELIAALDAMPGSGAAPQHVPGRREVALMTLALDEILGAAPDRLGVPLPHAHTGDKRLRALCEAVLNAPADRATLAQLARRFGASERTLARLFRDELGTTFPQWRQQVALSRALPMLARGDSVGRVAAACGYASESAFAAMFRAAMGQPPRTFIPRVS